VGLIIHQRMSWNRMLSPIREVISVASVDGLAYPEARSPSQEAMTRHRSGDSRTPELEKSLGEFRARFDEDPYSAETAYWLGAGLTASGELATARAVVDIGRVQNPEDERVWNLDAILTAGEGDKAVAREILGRLLEYHPDNELAQRNLKKLTPVHSAVP
jgi:TolA-binding protein